MVMLDIFNKLNFNLKFGIYVVHINYKIHDLADKSAYLIKEYCLKHNIKFEIKEVRIASKSNFEANAREVRYKIFNNILIKNKIKYICTAHHYDDQLETLYMKYIQNAPITSFRGILDFNNNIWRPFLDIEKSVLKKYALNNELYWIEDSTNFNKKYLRNKIRIDGIPKLKQSNSKLLLRLIKNKKQADKLFLKAKNVKEAFINNNKIKKFNNPEYFKISKSEFLNLDLNIKKIIIQSILSNYGINLQSMTKMHWETFWQFLNKNNFGNEFSFSSDIKFLITRTKFIIYNLQNLIYQKFELVDGLKWYNTEFKFLNKKNEFEHEESIFFIKEMDLKNKIFVRNWKFGDKIKNIENNKYSNISKIFNKNKFSKFEKSIYPILVNNEDKPILVPELRHNNCNRNNRKSIMVKWQQN